MQIQPRYDTRPIIAGLGGADVAEPFLRQRRRFRDLMASLGDDEWPAPSRCEGWSAQDLAAHLDSTNRFWHASISAGLAGTPTRMLTGFDPKATPAMIVDAARSATPAEALAALEAGTDALCDLVASLGEAQWKAVAETPAGHVPVEVLVHHALWDCWVHERDLALPLGRPVPEEADEVLACLRTVAALGPAFAVSMGTAAPATLVLGTTGPDACVVVEVDDRVTVHGRPAADPTLVLRGDAVHLLEVLSQRAPSTYEVPESHRWLVASLAEVFETV